jgi:hypothetical protein
MSGPRDQEELPGYDGTAERIRMLKDRIEALEAALREILSGHPDAFDLARAALAPEQDK